MIAEDPITRTSNICRLLKQLREELCSGLYTSQDATKDDLLKCIKRYQDILARYSRENITVEGRGLIREISQILSDYNLRISKNIVDFWSSPQSISIYAYQLGAALSTLYFQLCPPE